MKPRQPSAQLLPVVNGEAREMVPSPARGQGDRWERWGRKSSPVTTATTRTSPAASGFGYATGLSCRECGKVYELGPYYACEECFGPLEVCYDYPALTRSGIEAGPPNMWRYAPLLPVPPDIAARPTTEPGFTKLIRADNLAHALGMRRLWIKDDRGNPTHSFKDRVVAVALAAATEMGFKVLACPSTGNLANAVAAAAARAGVRSVVMVPADLELQKIITTAVYGGTFVTVDGTYDDVNRLASELAGEHPDWAFVNVNVRPYYAEGSKTLGFEIAEQLGWRLPEQVVVPIASGAQLVKVDKGFTELTSLGLVPQTPWRVFGAQATGCSPVSAAFAAGHDVVRPVRPDTIAKSLAIGNPADGPYVLERGPPHRRDGRRRERRRDHRLDPAARRDRGHLRRDGRRRHPRRAAQAAEGRPARPGGRDRDHQLGRRAEDPRRGGRGRGRARADQAKPRSVPGALLRPGLAGIPAKISMARTFLFSREAMSVTVQVRIPTILRSYTGGAAEVTAPEGTLREVIAGLDTAYPGLGGRIIDGGGKLRRFVNVYVGDEDVRFAQGLDTQVPAGERVSVIPAVAGGASGTPENIGQIA